VNTKLNANHRSERTIAELFYDCGTDRDYTGAAALLDSLTMAQWLLAGLGMP